MLYSNLYIILLYQFQIIHNLLEHIDRHQRNRLKLDNLSIPSPERHRSLRHQFSTDNMNAIPPFNIPNLRIDQRKTSSAEDMARKNSGGNKQTVMHITLFLARNPLMNAGVELDYQKYIYKK